MTIQYPGIHDFNQENQKFQNVQGKHALVTGGSRGIGCKIVEILAQNGCNVLILTSQKGAEDEIKQNFIYLRESEIDRIKTLTVDLTDPKQIVQFKQDFISLDQKIDYIFMIAGSQDMRTTRYGINKVMACNYIGHYTLIREFLPFLLSQALTCKIIVATCSFDNVIDLDIRQDNLLKRDVPNLQYHQILYPSKLYLILLIKYRLDQSHSNLEFYAINPGAVVYYSLKSQSSKNAAIKIIEVANSQDRGNWLMDSNEDLCIERIQSKFSNEEIQKLIQETELYLSEVLQ